MSRHRNPGGTVRSPHTGDNARRIDPAGKRIYRVSSPSPLTKGRIVVAAVAAGAFAAAGAGQALSIEHDSTDSGNGPFTGGDATAAIGVGGSGGSSTALPDLVVSAKRTSPSDEVRKLNQSQRIISKQAAERAQAKREAEAARREALRPKFLKPAVGTFTSGFGGRWGTTHYGIDLANSMNTPIVAAADGVIIEAGPASGFGLWVREQLSDGTILVYGHMNDYSVSAGQHVKAGEAIARMGARGESTGVHLHFEVWDPSGRKIDPLPWLNEHGVEV